MSKDIIVLAPNGRRQTIHCTPDTSILQILEQACMKQGFQPADYDLKHHNHILDLTMTLRFANLPNKATIEMVETDRKREETNVTIGLLLEDGERRTADFSPNIALYDLVEELAPSELKTIRNPTILYMRQEVTGESALREKTLRNLGLIKGRAILRLCNKAEEAKQANVSAVYRIPLKQDEINNQINNEKPGPSTRFDPISVIKEEKHSKPKTTLIQDQEVIQNQQDIEEESLKNIVQEPNIKEMNTPCTSKVSDTSTKSSFTEENLERRLHIEEEVTFLGTQKAIAYMQPDSVQDELQDLPDDFYELTIEEVRKMYHDLQQHRITLENTPFVTKTQKEELEKQTSELKLRQYKNVVVRIQFPDGIILQGIFLPSNTIEEINNFVKQHIKNADKKFYLFTTPLKETLDPKMTLLEAKFVPCILMHFKWVEESEGDSYLKDEIYTKRTSSDAASILASKYRAPSRRKLDDSTDKKSTPSSSKNSKVPKWFKN